MSVIRQPALNSKRERDGLLFLAAGVRLLGCFGGCGVLSLLSLLSVLSVFSVLCLLCLLCFLPSGFLPRTLAGRIRAGCFPGIVRHVPAGALELNGGRCRPAFLFAGALRAILQMRPGTLFNLLDAMAAFGAPVLVKRQRYAPLPEGNTTQNLTTGDKVSANTTRHGVQEGFSDEPLEPNRCGNGLPLPGGYADRQPGRHYSAGAACTEGSRPGGVRRHPPDAEAAEPLQHPQAFGELSRAQRNDARARV